MAAVYDQGVGTVIQAGQLVMLALQGVARPGQDFGAKPTPRHRAFELPGDDPSQREPPLERGPRRSTPPGRQGSHPLSVGSPNRGRSASARSPPLRGKPHPSRRSDRRIGVGVGTCPAITTGSGGSTTAVPPSAASARISEQTKGPNQQPAAAIGRLNPPRRVR